MCEFFCIKKKTKNKMLHPHLKQERASPRFQWMTMGLFRWERAQRGCSLSSGETFTLNFEVCIFTLKMEGLTKCLHQFYGKCQTEGHTISASYLQEGLQSRPLMTTNSARNSKGLNHIAKVRCFTFMHFITLFNKYIIFAFLIFR